MIMSWLTHSVEADIAEGIIHAKTSQQVWEDLRNQFSQKNAPAIYQVQGSIATITQGSSTVAAYYTKIKALWAELDTYRTHVACNQEKLHNEEMEEDRLMQFLMGLNDVFKAARSNILMMNLLPNVRQAYSLVIQEEMQRQVSSDTPENFSIAAAVQGKSFPSKNSKEKLCDHRHRTGHIIADCRTLKYHCTFCDKRGHTEDCCRLKNGGGAAQYARGTHSSSTPSAHMADTSQQGAANSLINGISPEYLHQFSQAVSTLNKNNQSGNNDVHANATGLSTSSHTFVNTADANCWILDSGATDHIISHPSLLSPTQQSHNSIVNLPNSATADITHVGTVTFNPNLQLQNVYCVPPFNLNLMFASKLTRDLNCSIILFPFFVFYRT